MRKALFVTSLAILSTAWFLPGQTPLPESRRSSHELFVYQLNEKDLRNLYLKEKGLDESMLHTFILSCAEPKDIPPLPRGNYILVRVAGNDLEYSDHTVDNFYYSVVRDERAMLFISDTLGNAIGDAVVKRGFKRLRFDEATRTYNAARIGDGKIVEVNNGGVLHYIDIDDKYGYRNNFFGNIWSSVKYEVANIFSPEGEYLSGKYSGFIVFSKPKYRPGETVRFKACIDRKGRPCKDEVEVALVALFPVRIDTVLASLTPYRPGMYEWEFPLSDSLNLRLDNGYHLILRDKRTRNNEIMEFFRYEDYELGRITFEAKTERKKYMRGDSAMIRFSARDENDMPVYDSRVDITVLPNSYLARTHYSESAFVPNVIWKHTFDMSGKAAGELVLPDSIFVDNTAMYYKVLCTLFDSGNEKRDQNLTIYMDTRDRFIDFKVERGILTIRELAGGESVPGQARLTAYSSAEEIVFDDSVTLPHSMPLIWMADEYEVETETSSGDLAVEDIHDNIIGYRFFRENGKIRLIVDNPAGFPFWYTIRKGRHIIERGYVTELDYSCKESAKSGYAMQLSYLLGEKARTIQGSLPYTEKNITMEVSTPAVVYPGQTATVEVHVRDRKGRPVRNADITAYAVTSKFGPYSPSIPTPGRSAFAKWFTNKWYDASDAAKYNARSPMDWDVWRGRMGLDSIEYYKFLYPEVFYSYSGKDPDGITQISPYVVIDGRPQGVHILWIDEEPHYFEQAQQLNVYSFPVAPGYHTLRFRTYDREVTAGKVYVAEGTMTIVSVNGSASIPAGLREYEESPLTITVKKYDKKERGILSEREIATLKGYMITVDRTFGTASLPGDNQMIDMPAMINAGGAFYYLSGADGFRYKYNNHGYTANSVLTGPFPYRGFFTEGKNLGTLYVDTVFVGSFEIEGGYRYAVWDNYLKQTNWEKTPFSAAIKPFTQNISFTQSALTPEKIRRTFHERLSDRARSISGSLTPAVADADGKCRLNLEIDAAATGTPVMIRLSNPEHKDSVGYIYYGGTRRFNRLPAGDCRIDLIFSDTTRYSAMTTIRPDGINYLKVKPAGSTAADSIGRMVLGLLHSGLKISEPENPLRAYELYPRQNRVSAFRPSSGTVGRVSGSYTGGRDVTGVVVDGYGEPLAGAIVTVEGAATSVFTDSEGKFTLPDAVPGNLSVSYLGFMPFMARLIPGYDYKITLEEDSMGIDKIVVCGMSTRRDGQQRSRSIESSEDGEIIIANMEVSRALEGRVAGVYIRGASSVDAAPPLIIVDGVPYEGALSDISPDMIVSMNVVKDATAIYGSRAANGVVFIYTKEAPSPADGEFPEGWSGANSLRTNFRDDAFWHPNLSTGKDGTVTFEVTYPDDITRWNANFIAAGGRKQRDAAQLSIKSFKPLNAQLSIPQFAIAGDSLNVIGRLTSLLGDTVRVRRTIEVQGIVGEENITISNSHIDHIPVVANEPDSIGITYSLTMESGYFDGERRSIPVYKPGVQESHGEFAVFGGAADRRFQTDPALGTVTVHAEASAVQSFLDEIDRVDLYPYFCNEQTASKIKALLLKKRIFLMSGTEFGDDKKIAELIKRLERNRNGDGLWGWWNKDATELWITRQVVGAMLAAEADGYKVELDRQAATDTFIRELNRRLSASGKTTVGGLSVKGELLDLLELLGKLGAQIDYSRYLPFISSLPDATVNDRLRCMETELALGLGFSKPQIDTLLSLASETLMGAMYWSEKESGETRPVRFRRPDITDTENTLTAYRILRATGGYDAELERIRNYFFEMRRSGSWRNTYESSRILAAIVPDMLKEEEAGLSNAAITLNGKRYGEFPLTAEFEAGETIGVAKTGSLPVFFTVYQQAWNETPEKASEGFSIETAFYYKDDLVTTLEAGKSVELRAKVTVDSDTEYVMIEVPIPAGCSYESKRQGGFRQEIHREYHKEKVAVFCKRLSKGTHEFTIKLIPRYTGMYHLNPAKVELMYYPTFFGREEIRLHGIE